nr:MAG TPA: hypothetical protein [Caudoviricetes sp.]
MAYKIGKITTHDGMDKVDKDSLNRLGRVGEVEVCESNLFDYMLFRPNNDPVRPSYEGFTTSGILRIVNGDNMKVIITENSVYVLYEVQENDT